MNTKAQECYTKFINEVSEILGIDKPLSLAENTKEQNRR